MYAYVALVDTAQHSTAQPSPAQPSPAQHSTAQHSTAQHSTAPLAAASTQCQNTSNQTHCIFPIAGEGSALLQGASVCIMLDFTTKKQRLNRILYM